MSGRETSFLLGDGSYAILDYESDYRIANKIKYGGYALRLLRRLQKEGMDISKVRLRIIIIYTADVTRMQTQDMLNVGDVIVSTTEAFLLALASEVSYTKTNGMWSEKSIEL